VSPARIAAAVLAVLLAGFVIWRRRRLPGERVLIALAAAAALAVYASGLLSLLPDPKKAIVDIAHALGPWTYALVGVFVFLETGAFVGLIAPGETVVMAGGVIAGQGEIQLLPLIGVVWACAVVGDSTSFFIGRRLGRRFLERHGSKVNITPQRLEQVEGYFQRHGGKRCPLTVHIAPPKKSVVSREHDPKSCGFLRRWRKRPVKRVDRSIN